jgi:hypothetical protein
MICIHQDVTGAGRHLVCESKSKGFQWTPDIPDGAWILGPDAPVKYSIADLAAAHGTNLSMFPSGKYAVSADQLLGRAPEVGDIAWRHYMTPEDFKSFVTQLVEKSFEILESNDISYYIDTYIPMMRFLSGMQRARIDKDVYDEYISSNVSPALRTFEPDTAGYASQVQYTKSRTKTGRLIVSSGPDILTLPKVCRDIIIPSNDSGAIAYVDYASMEPRFVLGLAGRQVDGDLYTTIGEIIGKPRAPRERLKLTITSVLYGAGNDSVARTMDVGLRTAVEISHKIDDYFNAGELRQRLEEEYKGNGFIRNFYGKRVYPDHGTPGLLLNNYAQSSAADGAILGFQRGTFEASEGTKTLFVLHDASFIDVTSVQTIKKFVKAAEQIPGLNVRMPLSVQRIGGKRV